jgi:serine/threonine-protein kinase
MGDLAAGKPRTLVRGSGGPSWSRWALGDDSTVLSLKDGPLALSTSEIGLLELVSHPPIDRYRFSAEVQQITRVADYGQLGIGLYFAHSKHPTAHGAQHCFCILSFDDILKPLRADPRKGRPDNEVVLETKLYCETKKQQGRINPLYASNAKTFLPAGSMKSWRRLTVEVTPTLIRAKWANDVVCELPSAEVLRRSHRQMATLVKILGDKVDWENVRPEFSPRGGLGLYVHRCSAYFRNVRIEPLGPGE